MLSLVPQIKSLATLKHTIRLSQSLACFDEQGWWFGIEREHIVVAGDYEPRADFVGKLDGFPSPEVSSNSPLGSASVDGKDGDIDGPLRKNLGHSFIEDRITTMVNRPISQLDHLAQ